MNRELFHEKIHKATLSRPYLDHHMTNLNYLSHFHEEIEALFVVRGGLHMSVNRHDYDLREGDIALLMPYEVHNYVSAGQNHVYIMKFMPAQDDGLDFSRIRLQCPVLTPESAAYDECRALLLDIFREDDERAEGYRAAVRAGIARLSLLICRRLPFERVSIGEKRRRNERLKVLQQVTDYVEEHYRQPISLGDAARAAGFSLYYFAHIFKEAAGCSFGDFLAAFRVEKVKRLLAVSEQSMTEIAFACGFSSIKTFNRTFSQYCGCAPSAYKKQNLTNNKQ